MTSKERVLAAVNHMESDRVPIDFWAEKCVKDDLCSYLGLRNEEELLQRLRVDIRCIYPDYVGPDLRQFDDGSFEDFWGVVRTPVRHATGVYYEVSYSPLAEAATIADIENCRWPQADWFDYSTLAKQCEDLGEYAVCLGKMGRQCQTIFVQTWYSRGLEKVMLDMSINPELVHAIVEKIMGFRVEHVTRMLDQVAGKADMLQLADDYGTQTGLFMAPSMWREFFGGAISTLAGLAHSYGLKAFLHSCGSVRDLIPDLIDAGIDILNPIQVGARNMDPAELKRKFGRDLCFHGSVDTQQTLPFGSRDDVVCEVRERLEVLGEGGGFIIAPTHTIGPDVPLENVMTFYDAAARGTEWANERKLNVHR